MALDLGNIRYGVEADTTSLDSARDDVEQFTDSAERARDASGRFTKSQKDSAAAADLNAKSVKRLYGQMARLFAVVGGVAAITGATREIGQFQEAINGLQATSNATERQMQQLESQARTLGATSRFSAQQTAEGQRFLAQAGFSVNEIMEASPGILKLATAGQLGLAEAADIASNVLGGMRLEVDQLNRVNDVLAATASRSNTNIQQLGQALSFAAPFAAGAGISIEEAAAAIGVMSDAGIQASRAGTGLVGTIRQLSKVTDEGEAVLDRYNLSVQDVSIEANGLGPVLERLRQANLSTVDAIALFGSEAGAAAQVLVQDYQGGIEGAEGEVDRMALTLNQGLIPAFRSLRSAISESILQFGDSGYAGALERIIGLATGVVANINGMDEAFIEANPAMAENQQTIDRIITGLETLISVGKVAAALYAGRFAQSLAIATAKMIAANTAGLTLVGTLRAIRTVALTLFGPVGLIAAGVIALGEIGRAFDDSEKRAEEFANSIDRAAESLSGFSQQALTTQIAAVSLQLEQARAAAQELDNLNRQALSGGGIFGGLSTEEMRRQVDLVSETGARADETVRNLEIQLGGLQNALETVRSSAAASADNFRTLDEWLFDVGGSTRSLTGDNSELEAALKAAREEAERFASAWESLRDRLDPVGASQRQFRQETELLHEALERGLIQDVKELDDWLMRLEGDYRNASSAAEVYGFDGARAARRVKEETDTMDEFVSEAARNIQGHFADFLFDPFENGIRGMLDSFTTALQRMVAEAVAADLGRRIFGSAVEGGSGGGWLGGALNLATSVFGGGGGTAIPGGFMSAIPSLNGGGFTGWAPRSGGMDGEGGFLAMMHPRETVVDHTDTRSGISGTTQNITNNFALGAPTDRRTQQQIAMESAAAQRRANARFSA